MQSLATLFQQLATLKRAQTPSLRNDCLYNSWHLCAFLEELKIR